MFRAIRNRWQRMMDWIEQFPMRRRYTISTVIEEEDKIDALEIEQANRVIVNHQYLIHMAEHRIQARSAWKELQATRGKTDETNVRPLPVLEQARSKRQA